MPKHWTNTSISRTQNQNERGFLFSISIFLSRYSLLFPLGHTTPNASMYPVQLHIRFTCLRWSWPITLMRCCCTEDYDFSNATNDSNRATANVRNEISISNFFVFVSLFCRCSRCYCNCENKFFDPGEREWERTKEEKRALIRCDSSTVIQRVSNWRLSFLSDWQFGEDGAKFQFSFSHHWWLHVLHCRRDINLLLL